VQERASGAWSEKCDGAMSFCIQTATDANHTRQGRTGEADTAVDRTVLGHYERGAQSWET
jgi:hypothetical protein